MFKTWKINKITIISSNNRITDCLLIGYFKNRYNKIIIHNKLKNNYSW